ncbi:MAG TPA: YibE/F family protein [Acidimicrobiales bacterium]|nr:YibE/F family protein [Acidimicrobiales bacterium]
MASGHDLPVHQPTARLLNGAAVLLALATVAGLIVFRPGGGAGRPDLAEAGVTTAFYDAQVLGARTGPCRAPSGVPAQGGGGTCRVVEAQLLEGPDAGRTVRLDFLPSSTNPDLDDGDKVVLSYNPASPAGDEYQFADRQRKPVLFWLAAAFALSVVLLGRVRGVAALVGLAASLVVLLSFTLPAVIDGRSPVGVAVVSAAAIAFIALYLAHGFRPMTTVALLGTLASLALTAVLAVAFTELAHFSGFASEEATFLSFAAGSIDLRGLLLGGVVIGALGAIDDITVTQAAAVAEVRRADPGTSRRELYRAGLRVGRDHVASTVNTLVLAYAGASMPLLVLFVLSDQSLTSVANSEVVATEIVRTLVGSIGLVASVPVTTWLAAVAVGSSSSAEADPATPGLLEDGAGPGGGETQPGG